MFTYDAIPFNPQLFVVALAFAVVLAAINRIAGSEKRRRSVENWINWSRELMRSSWRASFVRRGESIRLHWPPTSGAIQTRRPDIGIHDLRSNYAGPSKARNFARRRCAIPSSALAGASLGVDDGSQDARVGAHIIAVWLAQPETASDEAAPRRLASRWLVAASAAADKNLTP